MYGDKTRVRQFYNHDAIYLNNMGARTLVSIINNDY